MMESSARDTRSQTMFLSYASDAPTMPETIEHGGKTYARKEIAAYNVRPGDVSFLCDRTGSTPRVSFAIVSDVVTVRSTRRSFVPVERRTRVELASWFSVAGLSPLSFFMPGDGVEHWAPRDRVTVYREIGA